MLENLTKRVYLEVKGVDIRAFTVYGGGVVSHVRSVSGSRLETNRVSTE